MPISFRTDQECILTGLKTCWQPKPEALRLAVIPNTLELAELWASPVVVEEACGRTDLVICGKLQPLPFDAAGNLEQEKLFPHCVRSRRGGSYP